MSLTSPTAFSGRIQERYRRRHQIKEARYHSLDPSSTAVSESYWIFCFAE